MRGCGEGGGEQVIGVGGGRGGEEGGGHTTRNL